MITDSMTDAHVRDVVTIISLSIAALSFLALVALLAVIMHSRRSIQQRRTIVCILSLSTGFSASFPFAFEAYSQSFWSSLAWVLAGSFLIAPFALCFSALLARAAIQPIEFAPLDDDDRRLTNDINPATGYPMLNGSVDAGGFSYGCGPRSPDDDFGMGGD